MKKIKPISIQNKTDHESLTLPLSVEQFNLSGVINSSLEAQEISKLNTHITECEVKIKELETAIVTLLELKSALAACDRNKKDPITPEDVEAQINFFKREVHIYQTKIRRIEDKIQAFLTKNVVKSERYTKEMPYLKLQKKELELEIQKLEIAITRIKETTAVLKTIHSVFENVIRELDADLQIQLLEKDKQKYMIKLQAIETKITDLESHENQKVSVVSMRTQTNLPFFSGSHESQVLKKLDSELKFNGLKLS